jgi:hypothetical protein
MKGAIMAVTSGFFDAVDHDRLYNAEDVGSLLDGVISDGILGTYGGHFEVTHPSSGLNINVASGRGWFKNTWIKNDDDLILTAEENTYSYTRIDTVVIDVNKTDAVRANNILIVKGGSTAPALIDEAAHKQYPIADIKIDASEVIEITDRRTETPYATSPLMSIPLYPIGAIYISTSNRNPGELFGGTWKQLSGEFLIGCGDNDDPQHPSHFSPLNRGGQWVHKLSVENLPSHTHEISLTTGSTGTGIRTRYLDGTTDGPDAIPPTFMGWAKLTGELESLELSNYAPASWNYPYGYQGCGSLDQKPVVGPSPYSVTQTEITDPTHKHSVSGATLSTGSGIEFAITPPYFAVYMWERTG